MVRHAESFVTLDKLILQRLGCASSLASGGGSDGCAKGAASAVFGKWVTNSTSQWGVGIAQFTAATVAGGVTSRIMGGSFENGATTAAYGYLFNACMSVSKGCLAAWGMAGVNVVGGGLAIGAGVAACSTGVGCLMGAPGVAVGVGSVAEGVNWLISGDETTKGTNLIKDTVVQGMLSAGATEQSAENGYAFVQLGAAGMALKAPIAVVEKMWTYWGVSSTNGLNVIVPAVTTNTFRSLAPIIPSGKAAYILYEINK